MGATAPPPMKLFSLISVIYELCLKFGGKNGGKCEKTWVSLHYEIFIIVTDNKDNNKTHTTMNFYYDLKKLDEKTGTIRVVLTHDSQRLAISTGLKIPIKDWKDGKPKQNADNTTINLTLGKYQTAFNDYVSGATLANEHTTLVRAKDYIQNKIVSANTPTSTGPKTLNDLLALFESDMKYELKEGAIKPYRTLMAHLQDFNPKITLNDIDEIMSERFKVFLATKSQHVEGAVSLQNPTINKMIVSLKAFMKWAVHHKYTTNLAWKTITIVKKTQDQEIVALTESELNQFHSHDFGTNIRLAQQRDMFCLASYTGLRYQDLASVCEWLEDTDDGLVIHIRTQKNGKEAFIPVLDEAKAILDKYECKLPVISNQKMNEYIKEAAKVAKLNRVQKVVVQHLNVKNYVEKPIHQLLSIHDGRKTFITMMLDKGMTLTEVMKISTHSDLRSLMRYVGHEQKRVSDKLKDAFKKKPLDDKSGELKVA